LKIWIDALTPKQLRFAYYVQEFLRNRVDSVDTVVTTRRYSEVEKQLTLLKMDAEVIGNHGGEELAQKLEMSLRRAYRLSIWVKEKKPDILFHFLSPEACRVAFGMDIPNIAESDSPHASAVSRLTVPLVSKLFTPWVIPKSSWTRYGIQSKNVIHFRALDPFIWIGTSQLHEETIRKLHLKEDEKIVLCRNAESKAAYYRGINDPLEKSVIKLAKEFPKFRFILMRRYRNRRSRRSFPTNVECPFFPFDGLTVLKFSSLFIGSGGTMNQEAALLGVPNLSTFPRRGLDVARFFYLPKNLTVSADRPNAVVKEATKILTRYPQSKKDFERRAKAEVEKMRNPLPLIISVAKALARNHQQN
jgi:predicted glycosyltransferase